jgi:hypothetical protein
MNWLTGISQWIWAYLFGCIHRHTTWPQRNRAGFDYVCCLDCGKDLPYSWKQMRIVTRKELLAEHNHEARKHVDRVLVFGHKDSSAPRATAA